MKNFDYDKITVKEYGETIQKICRRNEEGCEGCPLLGENCCSILQENVVRKAVEKANKISDYDKIREKIEEACDGLCNEECPLLVWGNCMKTLTKKILGEIEAWENEQSIQQ